MAEKPASINPIQLQKHLKGVDYPATRESLMKGAKKNKADKAVMEFLEQIPEQEYSSPAQVTKQISGSKKK